MPLHTGDRYTFCGVSITHRGAFTKAGASELLLDWENCRDDDDGSGWNGSRPGSTMVVAEEPDGRFRQVAFVGGADGECRHVRLPEGRSVFFCRTGYAAGSIGSVVTFYVLDLAKGAQAVDVVARLYDEAEHWSCVARPPGGPFLDGGIAGLHVAKVTTSDVNQDGLPDLVVDVDRALIAPSPAAEARVGALCSQGEVAPGQIAGLLPKATRQRLVVASQRGSGAITWAPTAATRTLLDAWRAQSPNVQQLDGAGP